MTTKRKRSRAPNPRNRYAERPPDFAALAAAYPTFAAYVHYDGRGNARINWADYNATRELTKALLHQDCGVEWWIPDGQLCPAVINRANYIHWIEDLLEEFPRCKSDEQVCGIDIGTGANCIYPLLGASMCGWKFVATDVTTVALEWATRNVERNPQLAKLIEVRDARSSEAIGSRDAEADRSAEREVPGDVNEAVIGPACKPTGHDSVRSPPGEHKVLLGVLKDGEELDFCMCNPPFFESMEEAGLNPRTSCGGTEAEMAFPGGETAFVTRIIEDSVQLGNRIHWYTTMVGKKCSLKRLTSQVWASGAKVVKTTEFVQGRTSRWGLAWSFSTSEAKRAAPARDGSASFLLEGLSKQCGAWDVLQGLAAHLESNGAVCCIDKVQFTISGSFCDPDAAKRSCSNGGDDGEVRFKASVLQQVPGSVIVKSWVLQGQPCSRFWAILEGVEAALKVQFSSRSRHGAA